ncbi:hypothetical protein KQ945_00150 [Bacillus subtilis subsp. subtilis]|nr:hypothetical protein [Bacillus subtilis subsp. subtilis]
MTVYKLNKKVAASVLVMGVVGVAIACNILPMPPMPPITVNANEIAAAQREGFSNPAHGAFVKKLDEQGQKMMGDAWRQNGFNGHVAYTVKMLMITGGQLIYIEKPCGKTAEENARDGDIVATTPPSGGGFSGGGSGGEGGDHSGGWVPVGGGGCWGSCNPSVTVGTWEEE